MAAQSTAQHPADVGTYWEEVVGLYWETNRDLRVDCKKGKSPILCGLNFHPRKIVSRYRDPQL